MIIQHNLPALNAHRNLGLNNTGVGKNLEKLSSGYRINRAGDDAAGLAISEKMRGQIRGLGMAEQNVAHGINLVQTAEGALNETHAILQRMRELAVQASNGTYQNEDRLQIQQEYDALMSEITRISTSSEYNAMKLFEDTVYTRVSIGNPQLDPNSPWGPVFLNRPADDYYFYKEGAVSNNAFSGTRWAAFHVDIQVAPDGEVTSVKVLKQDADWFTITTEDQGGFCSFRVTEKGTGAFFEVLVRSEDFPEDFAGGEVRFNGRSDGATIGFTFVPREAFIWESEDVVPSFTFQIGANGTADQRVTMQSRAVNAAALGVDVTNVRTRESANAAIDILDDATHQISSFRAQLGALQNRLEHTLNNLGVTKENLTAAESTIRDADMAKEMMEFTKNSILVQAAQSMLAQANSLPQGVLSLLR